MTMPSAQKIESPLLTDANDNPVSEMRLRTHGEGQGAAPLNVELGGSLTDALEDILRLERAASPV